MSDPLAQAKTKWLQDFLREYLPQVQDLTPDTPNWQASAQSFAHHLSTTLEKRGLTEPEQQKNPRSQVANALRECHPHHPAIPYPYTLLHSDTYTQLNLEQVGRNEERLTKFFESKTAIAIVDKATELLSSQDPHDWAAALAVLVGRRISEILISRFQPCTAYSLWFSEPVKKGELTEFCPPYEIPTLIEADRVLQAIFSLRERWKIEDLKATHPHPTQLKKAINKRYEDVPKAVRRHFSDLVPARERDPQDGQKLYTHVFRSVYAEIATYFYKPALIPEHQFKAEIQGHFQFDSTGQQKVRSYTARPHYDDYKISDRLPSRDGIKLTEPHVSVLRVFSHAYSEDTASPPQTTANLSQKVANIEHFCAESQANDPEPLNPIPANFPDWLIAQYQLMVQIHEEKYLAIIEGKDALLAEKEASLNVLRSSLSQKDELITFLQSLCTDGLVEPPRPTQDSLQLQRQVQELSAEIEHLKVQLEGVTTQRDEAYSKLSHIQSFFDNRLETPSQTSLKDQRGEEQKEGAELPETTTVTSSQEQRNAWIDRAISAIKSYNNDPSRSFKEKWYISNTSLADLLRASGFKLSNRQISERRASRSHDLELHHQSHHLSSRHNANHDLPISQFISLT